MVYKLVNIVSGQGIVTVLIRSLLQNIYIQYHIVYGIKGFSKLPEDAQEYIFYIWRYGARTVLNNFIGRRIYYLFSLDVACIIGFQIPRALRNDVASGKTPRLYYLYKA